MRSVHAQEMPDLQGREENKMNDEPTNPDYRNEEERIGELENQMQLISETLGNHNKALCCLGVKTL